MKLLKTILLLALASAGLSHAAVVISIKNYTTLGSVGLPILDATGTPIAKTPAGGSISVGYFANGFDPSSPTATAASIKANFVVFGAATTTFSQNGMFNTNISATLAGNDTTFTGHTIYTVIGDGSSVASSTSYAVLTAGVLFPTVDAGGGGAATSITGAASNVVFGTLATPGSQPAAGNTYPQGVKLAVSAVPEPSAALLGMLGALGLLRRRR